MHRHWRTAAGAIALALCSAAAPASAQTDNYPSRPIKLVVPFPPGGASDAAGRIYAQYLTDKLGQTVVVENRAGAGGEIGADHVAKSDPDGYTLLLGALGSHSIHAALGESPYNLGKAFVGVSMASTVPMVVAVNSKVPVKSVAELIALAKEKPGKLTFGSAGPGTPQQMAVELFKADTHTNLLHVPYKGSGPSVAALLGGQVDIVFETLPALQGNINTGRIHVLAVTSAQRSPSMPDLPTLQEAGVRGYDVTNAYAVLAPARTPKPIVDKLAAAMKQVGAMPEVQQKFRQQGAEAVTTTPEQTTQMLQAELKKWTAVVQAAGGKEIAKK
ncbi:Bug family tripartite tricarboxylate transporter substrate binding protein [Bordetella genomosp. 11]|uniref:MFS transporter n=1 Tax=Bordetella genomosp. 11 TaxID=1416808 RepID=A0A261UGW6_9BORD|nr:tripartite tricarboxylate transporter substrate binding protein [Bordetella genomosp. 11]OZI60460.1 MFS transporter [Bordetella genomosp. 11]